MYVVLYSYAYTGVMNATLCSSHHPARSSLALVLAPIQYRKMATSTYMYVSMLVPGPAAACMQVSARFCEFRVLRINKNCGQLVSLQPKLRRHGRPAQGARTVDGNKSRYECRLMLALTWVNRWTTHAHAHCKLLT